VKAFTLDTVVFNHNAGAANNFAGITLPVNLAQSSPCAEDLGIANLDQIDFVFPAKSSDQFDVLGIRTGLDKDTQMGLTLVQCLGALTETASETVMDEGIL